MDCKRCDDDNEARWQVLDRKTGKIVDVCIPCIVDMMTSLAAEVVEEG